MLRIKQIFCRHVWEYSDFFMVRECRKCGGGLVFKSYWFYNKKLESIGIIKFINLKKLHIINKK